MKRKLVILVVILLFVGLITIPNSIGNIYKSQDVIGIDNLGKMESGIEFTRPENGIYYFDKKIFPFPFPLALCGNITVEAEIDMTNFDRIEFYINDGLHEIIEGVGSYYNYSFISGGPPFSKITYKLIGYPPINGT